LHKFLAQTYAKNPVRFTAIINNNGLENHLDDFYYGEDKNSHRHPGTDFFNNS